MLATSVTLGFGGSGGIFAPSLFMGAMFGGMVLVQTLFGFPATTDGYGKAALTFFPLPADAAWHGLAFYFQFIVQDPNSPQGHDLTEGLWVVVGH